MSAAAQITIRKLNSNYDEYAVEVLSDYLEELPRKKGMMRSYSIVQLLPTEQEYTELRQKHFTSTVADHIDIAFTEFTDLAGEVGDWYDNLPEGFQNGDKGSALEEAQGILDSLSQPEVPAEIGVLPVFYLPVLDVSSRASRRDDAVGRLQAVVDVIEESTINDQGLIEELEDAISEADGVEFPGMY